MNWHEYFTYNHVAGVLIWKARPLHHFKTERACKIWNTAKAHKPAGSEFSLKRGYKAKNIQIGGITYQYGRIVWELMRGCIEGGLHVDHINGDATDNRLSNLRLATRTQNTQNAVLSHRNKLRIKGVCFRADLKNPYVAQICIKGKQTPVGYFPTKGLAAVAYAKASLRYQGKFSVYYRQYIQGR